MLAFWVSVGGPDNKPGQAVADQVWKSFSSTNVMAGHYLRDQDVPTFDDLKPVLDIFKRIHGRKQFSVWASTNTSEDGVDVLLIHGLELIQKRKMLVPVKFEVYQPTDDPKDKDKEPPTIATATLWKCAPYGRPFYDEDGYMLNFDHKGSFELEVS